MKPPQQAQAIRENAKEVLDLIEKRLGFPNNTRLLLMTTHIHEEDVSEEDCRELSNVMNRLNHKSELEENSIHPLTENKEKASFRDNLQSF